MYFELKDRRGFIGAAEDACVELDKQGLSGSPNISMFPCLNGLQDATDGCPLVDILVFVDEPIFSISTTLNLLR